MQDRATNYMSRESAVNVCAIPNLKSTRPRRLLLRRPRKYPHIRIGIDLRVRNASLRKFLPIMIHLIAERILQTLHRPEIAPMLIRLHITLRRNRPEMRPHQQMRSRIKIKSYRPARPAPQHNIGLLPIKILIIQILRSDFSVERLLIKSPTAGQSNSARKFRNKILRQIHQSLRRKNPSSLPIKSLRNRTHRQFRVIPQMIRKHNRQFQFQIHRTLRSSSRPRNVNLHALHRLQSVPAGSLSPGKNNRLPLSKRSRSRSRRRRRFRLTRRSILRSIPTLRRRQRLRRKRRRWSLRLNLRRKRSRENNQRSRGKQRSKSKSTRAHNIHL